MCQVITGKMNAYLANIGVSYVKLHNLHWNVVGSQFKAVHEYLEALYDGMSENFDEIAEIIKMNEQMPLASMKEYLEVATIKELDSKEISVADSLKIVLEDIKILQAQADDIRNSADESNLYLIVAKMEDDLANYAKTIWFLKSMLK